MRCVERFHELKLNKMSRDMSCATSEMSDISILSIMYKLN